MITGKRPLIILLALILGGVFFFSSAASAQKILYQHHYSNFGDTRITLTLPFDKGPTHGFQSIRVAIKNDTSKDRNWRFRFDYSSILTTNSAFQVKVKAGEELIQDILVPVPWHFRNSTYRQENVSIQADGLPSFNHFNSEQFQNQWPNIIISEKVAARNLTLLNTHLKEQLKKSRSSSSAGFQFATTCDNKLLPTDWRAYIGYDALMIAADEWDKLLPAVKKAILEWVRFGSTLQIYTEPADRQFDFLYLGFDRKPVTGNIIRSPHSFGTIELHGWDGKNVKQVQTYNTLRHANQRRIEFEDTYITHWGLQKAFGIKKFNPLLVMLILTIFSIIVGPVNLFSFAKTGKRHRLFITTPLISIVASVLVMGIILLKDGVGGKGRRMLIMDLEATANEKRAYITQEQLSRTGVLLGNRLQIQDSTFIAPVQLADSQWSHKIDYSNPSRFQFNGNGLSGDWFRSRTEQAQVIQSTKPTRSRVELTKLAGENQAPRLFSSLEFSVEELFYVGEGGRVWKAKNSPIQPGSEIILEASTRSALSKWWISLTDTLSSGYDAKKGDHSLRRRTRGMSSRPGHFFAFSKDSKVGFIETLNSVKWDNSEALIFGPVILRPSSTESPADDKSAK